MADLSKNELEAMRILWEESPLKPGEIEKRFVRPIENATLRSTLRVLMEKGHVRRTKKGKAFVYSPKASREGVLSKMARSMAHAFTGGSSADLIAQLIRNEKLSMEEIDELRRIAGEKASNTKPRDRGRKRS
jgi:predicted transcriptional regulator